MDGQAETLDRLDDLRDLGLGRLRLQYNDHRSLLAPLVNNTPLSPLRERVRVRGIRTRITFIYHAKLNNIVFAHISGSFVASGFMERFYHNFAGTSYGHPSSGSIQP
jgi:hypothetical protein